ncbi:MAG: S41 family peptidase [Bdellovibrionota bacterium]
MLVFSFKLISRPDTVATTFDYKKSLSTVCLLVYQKHYLGREKLAAWYKDCLKPRLKDQHLFSDATNLRDLFVEEMKGKLAALNTSHLEIYTPQEDELTWSGQSSGDNGLRVLPINGRFFVFKVLPDSTAAENGFRVGDQIVGLPNAFEGAMGFEGVEFSKYSGSIEILRGTTKLHFKIEALPLKVDSSPALSQLKPDIGWLQISSFRKEYFIKSDWQSLVDSINKYQSVIVDLRGNLGGDFGAVVRALSSFVCADLESFGELVKPNGASTSDPDAILEEDLSEDAFYSLLVGSPKVVLMRFAGTPCYKGRLTVLIDGDSASVSEIFAATVAEKLPDARVWGTRTRGDMLLGVWYPLEYVGRGYTISIPEAVYRSDDGFQIEGRGVTPERELFYSEEKLRHGIDSWLEAATE